MPNDFNQKVIDEFRANRGQVGGPFERARLMLLTTTGARTGLPHTAPVGYLPDGDARFLIIASAGGAPTHPDWFHNLVACPRVTIEYGPFTFQADAVVLEGTERDEIFARAVEADPGWADYQAKTTRQIPVVALHPIHDGPPARGGKMGESLRAVHDAFRRELSLIRAELTESGPGLGAQLRVNCLTLCGGLHHHHMMEDNGLFPALAAGHPELGPVMKRLDREHVRVAALVAELRSVLSAKDTDPRQVLGEVDRLSDELEAHLAYEEEHLIPVLDQVAPHRPAAE